jgi:hypothetical protein
VYSLVAENTPDEWLQGYASSKKLMMDIMSYVYPTESLPGFEHIHKMGSSAEEWSEDELPARGRAKKKSKAPVRQLKQATISKGPVANEGDESEAQNAEEVKAQNEDEDDGQTEIGRLMASTRVPGTSKGESKSLTRQKPAHDKASAQAKAPRNMLPPKAPQDTLEKKGKQGHKAAQAKTQKKAREHHPDFPELGPIPREQTKAREKFDKRVAKLQAQRVLVSDQAVGDIQAQVEDEVRPLVLGLVSEPTGPQTEEPTPAGHLLATASTVSELKSTDHYPASIAGDDETTLAVTSAPVPTHRASNLTGMQAVMLAQIHSRAITVEEAQAALVAMNKSPLPDDMIPGDSASEGNFSGPGALTIHLAFIFV